MREPKKRKVHTSEYKAKVALEALRSGKTINQIDQSNLMLTQKNSQIDE